MKTFLLSDVSIINGLKNRENGIIRMIYTEYFDMISKLVKNFSGRTEDTEDIFQDALIIIFRKINSDELNLTCSFKTYFFAVCRNLVMQKFSKPEQRLTSEFKDEDIAEECSLDDDFSEHVKYNLFQRHFLKLSQDCQKVLTLFLKKTSLQEITGMMGFSSIDYTKTRKYLCKESLKQNILNDPDYRKYFV